MDTFNQGTMHDDNMSRLVSVCKIRHWVPNGHATQHEGRSSKGCTDANRAIALSPATNGSIYQSSHGSYGSQQRAHKKKVMSWTALFLKMILKVFQNPFSCFLELTSICSHMSHHGVKTLNTSSILKRF